MNLNEPLEQIRKEMPAVFAGASLDTLTANGYRWRTLQNEKSRKETPENMFLRQGGRKLLVVRDVFLPYWQGKLEHA